MMHAFHGDAALKQRSIERLQRHMAAARLLPQQRQWESGGGGPAGCTVEDADPAAYERQLGIPATVLPMMETLYREGVRPQRPDSTPAWVDSSEAERGRSFAADFLEAIPVGADLSTLATRFIQWLLADPNGGLLKMAADPEIREVVEQVAQTHGAILAQTAPDSRHWAALRARAMALRDRWPQDSISIAALAADVTETAAWPGDSAAGRIAEEALNAYLQLANGLAALTCGWTEDDAHNMHQLREKLRNALYALPETGDETAKRAAASELARQWERQIHADYPELVAGNRRYIEELFRRRWLLARGCQDALLDLLRATAANEPHVQDNA